MKSATLVYPHQLFPKHPALKKDRPVFLIEDGLFFGDKHAAPGRFHVQKIVLHRASMKAYADELSKKGYTVTYIDYDREKVTEDHIRSLQEDGYESVYLTDCCDFLLEKRLRRTGIELNFLTTPMFLTPADWADAHFDSRKKPFMAKFYEEQRKRMGILVDADGKPEGGRWSYDDENRKPMPKRGGLITPADLEVKQNTYVKEAIAYTEANFADYPGQLDTFAYPVTRKDSLAWLKRFLAERFVEFGPYEDAISHKERTLFHSLLTPVLNIGLLTPQEIVDAAMKAADEKGVPLNSLEGFLRQIIGWREFMYIMYRRHGLEMRTSNFFDHQRDLPEAFWTGETGVFPVDHTIQMVLKYSYCHHIERLMVLGNFLLLGGYHPTQVNDWYMELFIDAYDWVMVPNVYGMSQFADGGIFTTKPYISGSNYVKKMSDYPKGEWCDIWDSLFWSFISRERDFFIRQHRLGMLVRSLDKMDEEKRLAHRQSAESFHNILCNK